MILFEFSDITDARKATFSKCERRAGDFFCIHTVNLQLMWGLWMK